MSSKVRPLRGGLSFNVDLIFMVLGAIKVIGIITYSAWHIGLLYLCNATKILFSGGMVHIFLGGVTKLLFEALAKIIDIHKTYHV
jgi:hypothetical protein